MLREYLLVNEWKFAPLAALVGQQVRGGPAAGAPSPAWLQNRAAASQLTAAFRGVVQRASSYRWFCRPLSIGYAWGTRLHPTLGHYIGKRCVGGGGRERCGRGGGGAVILPPVFSGERACHRRDLSGRVCHAPWVQYMRCFWGRAAGEGPRCGAPGETCGHLHSAVQQHAAQKKVCRAPSPARSS